MRRNRKITAFFVASTIAIVAVIVGFAVYHQQRKLNQVSFDVPKEFGGLASSEFELDSGKYVIKAIPQKSYGRASEKHSVAVKLSIPSADVRMDKVMDLSFPGDIVETHLEQFELDSSGVTGKMEMQLKSVHKDPVQIKIQIIEAVLFRTVI
ncbi:MAG: hypothetical protein GY854_05095 [Deltaproteobacteria bacterium]|nr:hypothetical protein [Deltaproteobacteria bacterium]